MLVTKSNCLAVRSIERSLMPPTPVFRQLHPIKSLHPHLSAPISFKSKDEAKKNPEFQRNGKVEN